jgi:POT family proton-dependent oligopeptide transporter
MARCSGPIPGAPLHVYSILSCEVTERLCYYGVRAVLVLFLLSLGFNEPQSVAISSYWIALCYFSPLLGAVLADGGWGRFKTIFIFTVLYVIGMLTLTAGAYYSHTPSSFLGLGLVAMGAGGIKPCVGPFGADQLQLSSPAASTSYWLIFYVCINLGSLASYFAVPLLRARFGFAVALALPAASMALSALVFLAPARLYTRIPPEGSALVGVGRVLLAASFPPRKKVAAASTAITPPGEGASGASTTDSEHIPLVLRAGEGAAPYHSDTTLPPSPHTPPTFLGRARGAPGVSEDDLDTAAALSRLLPFFALLPFFWAVYDSHSSVFLLQARRMQLCFGSGGGVCLAPDQVSVLNPLLVVTLVPVIDTFVLPALMALPPSHWLHPTPLRRMSGGMFLATLAFACTGVLQQGLEGGAQLHVAWQVPQYVLLALAEVGVSATGLEFFFGEAPPAAKSVVLALFFTTTALGDLLNGALYSAAGGVGVAALVWAVTALCASASVAFAVLAARYVSVATAVKGVEARVRGGGGGGGEGGGGETTRLL